MWAALAGGIEDEQTQRHQRIAEEVGNFQYQAQAGAGGARGSGGLGHQPAVEGQQALLDAMVGSLKELPGLPVRHQEESNVSQSRRIET